MTYKVVRLTGDYSAREKAANAAGCACVWQQHLNSGGALPRYALMEIAAPYTARERACAKTAVDLYAALIGGGLGYGDGVNELADGARGESIIDGNVEAYISEPLFASNAEQAAWVAKRENQRRIAECNVAALKKHYPSGSVIGLSVGHIGKTSQPSDRGATVVGTGLTEADVCTNIISDMEVLLTEQEDESVKVIIGTPGRVWRLARGTEHLWRNDAASINAALNQGFALEGDSGAFDLLGSIPVHSLRSPNGDTLLSIDGSEITALTANGWQDEGSIGGAGIQGVPVYRLSHGKHMHTTDPAERAALIAQGWTDEGIGFYCGILVAPSDQNERIAALEAKLDKAAVLARELVVAVS